MWQASPYEVTHHKKKLLYSLIHKKCSHKGLPHELIPYTNYLFLLFHANYGYLTASAVGTTGESRGCSSSGRTTFGSELGSMPFVGSATSAWCAPSVVFARRASITHYVETCSATNCACGSKLSPSAWMASGLQPSAYPRQMATKSSSRWCVTTDVSTLDVL